MNRPFSWERCKWLHRESTDDRGLIGGLEEGSEVDVSYYCQDESYKTEGIGNPCLKQDCKNPNRGYR